MTTYPFGLQLYSVRDQLQQNPGQGLTRVRDAGYTHVELAGMYGLAPLQLKVLLDGAGLTPISMHVPYEELTGQLDQVLKAASILGVSYIVVPWLGAESCADKDAWLKANDAMDKAGAVIARENTTLCYHNHAHEFESLDDTTIFELIFDNSAPENLKCELDLGWAVVAKAALLELLKKLTGRVPLVHVKDFKSVVPPAFTELGKGVIYWEPILASARDAGAKWFIVEQDESEQDTIESSRENALFMRSLNAQ